MGKSDQLDDELTKSAVKEAWLNTISFDMPPDEVPEEDQTLEVSLSEFEEIVARCVLSKSKVRKAREQGARGAVTAESGVGGAEGSWRRTVARRRRSTAAHASALNASAEGIRRAKADTRVGEAVGEAGPREDSAERETVVDRA